jgi:hypothetical protein
VSAERESAEVDDGVDPGDPQQTEPRGEGPLVLWALTFIAALAALASRAVEPALPGIWVGIDHVIALVKIGGALASQLFAVASTPVIIALVLATLKSSLPAYLRAYSVGAGLLVIVAVLIASAVRLPDVSRLVLAATAAALALMCVRLSARLYALRAASLVLAAGALAGAVRVITIVASSIELAEAQFVLAAVARTTATISGLLEVASVGVAIAWLVLAPSAERVPRAPNWAALAVLVAASVALTVLVALGSDPMASRALILTARAGRELLLVPAPYLPELMRLELEALRWCTVVLVLALRPRGSMMSASVALGLIAGAALEVPLCAASAVIGALALALHPGARFAPAKAIAAAART